MSEQRLRGLDCIALLDNYRNMPSERCGLLIPVPAEFTGVVASTKLWIQLDLSQTQGFTTLLYYWMTTCTGHFTSVILTSICGNNL